MFQIGDKLQYTTVAEFISVSKDLNKDDIITVTDVVDHRYIFATTPNSPDVPRAIIHDDLPTLFTLYKPEGKPMKNPFKFQTEKPLKAKLWELISNAYGTLATETYSPGEATALLFIAFSTDWKVMKMKAGDADALQDALTSIAARILYKPNPDIIKYLGHLPLVETLPKSVRAVIFSSNLTVDQFLKCMDATTASEEILDEVLGNATSKRFLIHNKKSVLETFTDYMKIVDTGTSPIRVANIEELSDFIFTGILQGHDSCGLFALPESLDNEVDDDFALSDAWIVWEGGVNPFHQDKSIEYEMRDGDIGTERSRALRWTHIGSEADIVKYRILGGQNATS